MPDNEQEFQLVCDRMRRMGHAHEPNSHMKMGAQRDYLANTVANFPHSEVSLQARPGIDAPANLFPDTTYHFPMFDQSDVGNGVPGAAATADVVQYLASGASGAGITHYPTSRNQPQEEDFLPFPDEQCSSCGSFFEEEFSSGTDSDYGEPIPSAQSYTSLQNGNPRNSNDLLQATFQDYVMAKKLWRRLSKRPPRRYRKFNRFQKRHKPKFGGRYAAFLPQNAFAGHRGPAAGPKRFSGTMRKGNPRDPTTGEPLKCNLCGSTEHLWRQCSKNKGQAAAAGAHFGAPAASCGGAMCGACGTDGGVGHLFTHGTSSSSNAEIIPNQPFSAARGAEHFQMDAQDEQPADI